MSVPAPVYTVDGLVDSVKNKYLLPDSQVLLTTQNFVDLLDEEMRTIIIPLIISCHSEYFVTNYDQTITSSSNAYDLPRRSVGGVLRDVLLVDGSGNEYAMNYIDPSMAKINSYPAVSINYPFTIRNDQVILLPETATPPTSCTLRMRYERRPNNLTLSTNCGQIESIDDTELTLSTVDTEWTTSTTFDIIQNHPQFRSISDDQDITDITGSVVTLDESPTGIAVGHWVCPAYMTCIPQLPYEAFPALVQRGIMRASDAIGEKAVFDTASKMYDELAPKLVGLLTPRVKGTPKIIRNPNIGASRGFGVPLGWAL